MMDRARWDPAPARLKARWLAEYAGLSLLETLLRSLNPEARLVVGRAVGRLAWRIDRRHRNIALDNVASAYPDATPDFHDSVARGSFEHLGRLLVEVLFLDSDAVFFRERSTIEGWEHLEKAATLGHGFFVLSGHYGNWELVAHLQAARGIPMWMITRPLDNPLLEERLAAVRSSSGNRIVHKKHAVREMVKGLREGAGIAILVDQNFSQPGAEFVPFFGRLAATAPTLSSLTPRLKAPVVPVFSVPKADGGYHIVYGPPVFAAAATEEAGRAVTLEATRLTEEAIRRHPQAWFWMHRRWKSRPPGE